jgi:hypothetical protein
MVFTPRQRQVLPQVSRPGLSPTPSVCLQESGFETRPGAASADRFRHEVMVIG